jgi:hypothetical protein
MKSFPEEKWRKQQMDLLDRYLQAVKFWLPKSQQDDITAELREDLQSRIEEREAELGHPLDEAAIAEVLRSCGRPILVASRYQSRQQLIGPLLFPAYLLVLKIALAWYLVPWSLIWISLMIFNPAYRASHPVLPTLARAWGHFWIAGLSTFAVVTIIFAIIERVQAKTGSLERWDPRKLPPRRDSRIIKRSSSITEIIANLVLALWWAGGWASDVFLLAGNVQIVVAPLWTRIVTLLVLTCVANIALAVYNLFHPAWTRTRAWLRLSLDTAGGAIFCWFLRAHLLLNIVSPGLSSEKAATAVHAINTALATFFPYTVAATVLIVAIADLPGIVRYWPSGRGRGLSQPNLRPN